jgi:hypothetical protein
METKLGDLLSPSQIVGTVELEVNEASFAPIENNKSLLKGLSHSEFGEVRQALLGRRAVVSIASPEPNTVRLSVEANRERVLVPLLCTFDPDPDVHFNYARVEGLLITTPPPSDSAVAEEMFPSEINAAVQVSRDLKLSPKFSFHDVEVEPVELSAKKDYILFEPEILALHIGTQKPAWSLRSTSGKNIAGVKYLFLVVSKPAGRAARLGINVGGAVQTNFGSIPIAWVKKDRVASLIIKI